jgi:Tol biopolymer transport system component
MNQHRRKRLALWIAITLFTGLILSCAPKESQFTVHEQQTNIEDSSVVSRSTTRSDEGSVETQSTTSETTVQVSTSTGKRFENVPDGKIVFVSNREYPNDIFIMNSDGSEVTRLTNNQAEDWYPVFSPDGSMIVFTSDRDNQPGHELYAMNLDGTNQTRLTFNGYVYGPPVFSPDGKKIYYSTAWGPEESIYEISIDGFGETWLAYGSCPSVSRDGTKITYASYYEGYWGVYVMDADGSNQKALAVGFNPSFSSDGSEIMYVSWTGRAVFEDIFVINSDGSDPRQLTYENSNYNFTPHYSPDGTKIVFPSNRDDQFVINIMDSDGSNQYCLTDNENSYFYPVFTPNGQHIIFCSSNRDSGDIFIASVDGSIVYQLTEGDSHNFSASFFPVAD